MIKASIFSDLKKRLNGRSVFYVCRDVERATALLNIEKIKCSLITNPTPYALQLKKKYPDQILFCSQTNKNPVTTVDPRFSRKRDPASWRWREDDNVLDTRELLLDPETKKNIKKGDFVLVFKNTEEIEKICQTNGWRLLNPSAKLSAEVEEKISQVKWLGDLKKYLPRHQITVCEKINWRNQKFILQFNRAHTGSGTILIKNKKELEEIKQKFPQREARVTKFIDGPSFTNNNIVWDDKILIGNIDYQITGLSPFTDSPFATIGNDWSLPEKILTPKQITAYRKICLDVGKKLFKDGWRGLFGVDAILDKKTEKFFLIEINARQPASTTYESELQARLRTTDYSSQTADSGRRTVGSSPSTVVNAVDSSPSAVVPITTFESHLASLIGVPVDGFELTKINDGAQIVKRVISKKQLTKNKGDRDKIVIHNLKSEGFKVIEYANSKPGADALRIQSKYGIMIGHNKFNKIGNLIKNLTFKF